MIGGNLAFGIGWWGANQSGSSSGKSCGKILQENLAGNSCRTRRRGKSQFKKGSDWWKFTIWNRVMGSKPIRIQLGKILWENLAGNSCGKILRHRQCSAHFLPFLGLLQAIKHHQTFFSCRGGSKLWFGRSYVKISQELASEMQFLYR